MVPLGAPPPELVPAVGGAPALDPAEPPLETLLPAVPLPLVPGSVPVPPLPLPPLPLLGTDIEPAKVGLPAVGIGVD
jgi:hypothetical protein